MRNNKNLKNQVQTETLKLIMSQHNTILNSNVNNKAEKLMKLEQWMLQVNKNLNKKVA